MPRKLLSATEKKEVVRQRPCCFICGESISDRGLSELDFDHIVSLDAGGTNELTNFAAVHKRCHAGKRTKSLQDYKEEKRLNGEFSTLQTFADVRRRLNPSEEKIQFHINYDTREIAFGDGSKAQLHRCCNTKLWYFYHPLNRKYLESDIEVQPRGLEQKRLRNLALNLRKNFQLSPTACRLVTKENRIKVFDGQHKAAAQGLGNQNETIDCKVFIDPELAMVRRVVIEGHGALRQQEFKTSELFKKLRNNYEGQLKQWQDSHPGRLISEAELPQALGKTKEEAEKDILAFIVESILEDGDCEVANFVSRERKPGKEPISFDMFAWWVKLVIRKPLVDEPMESPENLREEERQNFIRLSNYVAQNCLQEKWTPNNPDNIEYKKAKRLFYRASFREWTKLLNDAIRIVVYLRQEEPLLYRRIEEADWRRVETACLKLVTHPVWMDPNPQVEGTLSSNIQKHVANLFHSQSLNPQFLCTP
jgi:hypothetical protein